MNRVCDSCSAKIFNKDAMKSLWQAPSQESDGGRCLPLEGDRLFFNTSKQRVLEGVTSECPFCVLLLEIMSRDLEHRDRDLDKRGEARGHHSKHWEAERRMKLFLEFYHGLTPLSQRQSSCKVRRMFITEDWEDTRLWPYHVFTSDGERMYSSSANTLSWADH